MYKIYMTDDCYSFNEYVGKARTIKSCIRIIHDYVEENNLSIIMEDVTPYNMASRVYYKYEKPAYFAPKKGADCITYSVATHYRYARKAITTSPKLHENAVVVNLCDGEEQKVKFYWKEV